jgi:hypothetical protein
VDGVEEREAAGGDHSLAAAATAVADEIDTLPHVLPELYQVVVVGLLQQIESLGDVHKAGVFVAGKGGGGAAEGHADVHRRVAGPAHVLHLVAAVAHSHGHRWGVLDHLAGSLVVKHLEGVLRP